MTATMMMPRVSLAEMIARARELADRADSGVPAWCSILLADLANALDDVIRQRDGAWDLLEEARKDGIHDDDTW